MKKFLEWWLNLFWGVDIITHFIIGGLFFLLCLKLRQEKDQAFFSVFLLAISKEAYDYMNTHRVDFETCKDIIATVIGALFVHIIISYIDKRKSKK